MPGLLGHRVHFSLDGELSTHVEDARIWATTVGAERLMRGRGGGSATGAARETAGQTVSIVPVRMHPALKTVPAGLAVLGDSPAAPARRGRAPRTRS